MHEIRLGSGALQLCVFCGRSVRALHVASMDLHAALLGRRPEINEQSPAAAVPKSVAVPKSAMTSIMWFKSVHHALHRHVHFQPEQENKQNHKGRWGGAKGGKGSGPTPRALPRRRAQMVLRV